MKTENNYINKLEELRISINNLGGHKKEDLFFNQIKNVVNSLKKEKIYQPGLLALDKNIEEYKKGYSKYRKSILPHAKKAYKIMYQIIKSNDKTLGHHLTPISRDKYTLEEINKKDSSVRTIIFGHGVIPGISPVGEEAFNLKIDTFLLDMELDSLLEGWKYIDNTNKKFCTETAGAWMKLKQLSDRNEYYLDDFEDVELERDEYWRYINILFNYLSKSMVLEHIDKNLKPPGWGWISRESGECEYKFGEKTLKVKGKIRKAVFEAMMDVFEKKPEKIKTSLIFKEIENEEFNIKRKGVAEKVKVSHKRMMKEIVKINKRLEKRTGFVFKGTGKGFYKVKQVKKG